MIVFFVSTLVDGTSVIELTILFTYGIVTTKLSDEFSEVPEELELDSTIVVEVCYEEVEEDCSAPDPLESGLKIDWTIISLFQDFTFYFLKTAETHLKSSFTEYPTTQERHLPSQSHFLHRGLIPSHFLVNGLKQNLSKHFLHRPLRSTMSQFGSMLFVPRTVFVEEEEEEKELSRSAIEVAILPDDLSCTDACSTLRQEVPVASNRYPSIHQTHSFFLLTVLQFQQSPQSAAIANWKVIKKMRMKRFFDRLLNMINQFLRTQRENKNLKQKLGQRETNSFMEMELEDMNKIKFFMETSKDKMIIQHIVPKNIIANFKS